MSLRQHGNHTAIKRKKKITMVFKIVITPPRAIIIWKRDAQVLNKTCPECGSFVVGFIKEIPIPVKASGLTRYHFSINPI